MTDDNKALHFSSDTVMECVTLKQIKSGRYEAD